jgi:putative RNA 2'-phosphotransferase
LEAILREGLRPMTRLHVHLSTTVDTARRVGARRGKPVVLAVDAQLMSAHGHAFYVSDNGVWLTAAVAPTFLTPV